MRHDVIVDTDIWVYLVLSDFYERIIKYHGKLYFSDVVENEIMKWHSNIGKSKEIAENFKQLKKKNQLVVIQFDTFETLERMSIEHQLSEYGLKTVNIAEKNKGEFVSYLYAIHKKIPHFKTNDKHFAHIIASNSFKVEIQHWNELLDQHAISIKEKQDALNKVKSFEKKMVDEHHSKIDPRWEKLRGFI